MVQVYGIRHINSESVVKTMTDKYKHQRALKNDIIDLTSDHNDVISNNNMRTVNFHFNDNMSTVNFHFNNSPFDDDEEGLVDDGLSMMHQLGSVSCTVSIFSHSMKPLLIDSSYCFETKFSCCCWCLLQINKNTLLQRRAIYS